MWNVRLSEKRGTAQLDWLSSKHTFSFGHYWDPAHLGFGVLRVINEDRVRPGAGFPRHPHRDMEILSYVLDGALEHKDSMGNGSIIRPGELQYMSAGSGVTHSEHNAAPGALTHFYQIWIVPEENGGEPRYGQIRIEEEARHNRFSLIAGGKRFDAPVEIRQDAGLLSARLDSGEAIAVRLEPSRQYWIQLVRGGLEVTSPSGDVTTAMKAGDGLALRQAGELRLLASEHCEALLFDLPLG